MAFPKLISAVSWVRKGITKPVRAELEPPSKEEIEEFLKSANEERSGEDTDDEEDMEVEDVKKTEDVSLALAASNALGQNSAKVLDDAMKELHMDDYDDEEDGVQLFASGLRDTYYASNDMDPYIKNNDDDDEEEIEDLAISPSDAVIVCASTEDGVSQLQVSIFEELEDGDCNLFSHHDIILPDIPLCTAWLDCNLKGGDKGNFMAVGSVQPTIEIWNLDIVDEVKPVLVLGGKETGTKGEETFTEGSHTGSVLRLSWNKEIKKYLASASADKSVKIWDVVEGQCVHTRNHHKGKVQAVAWNPHVADVLLSGSFDKTVVLVDMRYPSHTGTKVDVPASVEYLAWDPYDLYSFVVSLANGTVQGFDVRAALSGPSSCMKPCFTIDAHTKAVNTVCYNHTAKKLIATGSEDKSVKLWDLTNNQPSCVATCYPKAGDVLSVSFSEDDPFLLAIGGTRNKLRVWDISTESEVTRRFGKLDSTSDTTKK